MLTQAHLGERDLQNQLCDQFRAELSYLLLFSKHVQKVRMCSIESHGCKKKDICEQLRGPPLNLTLTQLELEQVTLAVIVIYQEFRVRLHMLESLFSRSWRTSTTGPKPQ